MKPIKYFAAAALAVLAAGCNKEQTAGVADGNEVQVSFTAELPGMQTKAIGDGLTAKNLTVEVYEDESGSAGNHIQDLKKTATFTDLHTNVEFILVKGKTYHFIFWSQADNAPYSLDADAGTVFIDYSGAANDENRDAFYAVKTLRVQGPAAETVQLHRPFAQVNFGTADFNAAAAGGVRVETSKFTASDAARTFDIFAGEGKDAADIAYAAADIPDEDLRLSDGTTYKYLSMNYFIPVGKLSESHVSNVKAEFMAGNDKVEISSPSTPVQANWCTNIVGNLLTEQVVFDIEIVPAFIGETEIRSVTASEELYSAVAAGRSVKLAADITLDRALAVPAGKEVVLDLGGHVIGNASSAAAVVVDGSLEIIGTGTVDGGRGGDNQAVQVSQTGKLVIRGGKFTVGPDANSLGNSCIENRGGDIEIYGGYFSSEAAYNGKYYVLNQLNSNPGTITVYGGEFENYDPAAGDDFLGGSFLAPGCVSVKVGDAPAVYSVSASR